LAREAQVQNLILTHISRRYREREIIAEARRVFPSTIVARDLDHFCVRRGQPIEKVTTDE
jgi:ribonuclease Z